MENQRLDLFIMQFKTELSRSTIKNMIFEGIIKVNDEKVTPNYKIKEGDKVDYDDVKITKFLKHHKSNTIKPFQMPVKVLFEDGSTIVVDKPEGLNSHPANRKDTKSLLNGIYYYIQNQQEFDKDVRIRLIHRLDKETSGVILASKNQQSQEYYSSQFENRTVKKEYFAIVHGDFERTLSKTGKASLNIKTYIGPERGDIKKFKNTSESKGKIAKTEVFFEKHFNKFGKRKFSLVRVAPETGRQHQIRVHLASRRHPILGDTLYGGQKYKRLMLHAHSLDFTLLNGKRIKTTSELPEKFID